MDMFQIECFLCVVKKKSFTEASFDISISQSSLSKHISKLESEVGVRLLDRSRRVVELTPAGEDFLPYAERLQKDYYDMQAHMKQWTSGGKLHIGSIEHMGRVGLTAPIASFLTDYPAVHIEIEKGGTTDLMDRLTEHKLDMAFIAHILSPDGSASNIDAYDLTDYELKTLVEDTYHVIVPQNHPFAGRDSISWEELAQEKLVILDRSYSSNAIIRSSFAHYGIRPRIAFESDQVDTLLGLVADGFGVSILSKKIAEVRYDVCAVRLDQPLRRNTVMVVPREAKKRRILRSFCEHILRCYSSSPGTSSPL